MTLRPNLFRTLNRNNAEEVKWCCRTFNKTPPSPAIRISSIRDVNYSDVWVVGQIHNYFYGVSIQFHVYWSFSSLLTTWLTTGSLFLIQEDTIDVTNRHKFIASLFPNELLAVDLFFEREIHKQNSVFFFFHFNPRGSVRLGISLRRYCLNELEKDFRCKILELCRKIGRSEPR